VALKGPGRAADACRVGRRGDDWGDDRGDIVLGWLTKLTVTLAVLGLVGFDLVSVLVGRLQAEDRAGTAARAAVSAWSETKDVQRAYDAAVTTLEDQVVDGIDPASFSVGPDGAVTLTVTHAAPTLLMEKVAPLRERATTTATVTARPAT